jgi:hypothetical protein
MDIRLAIQGLLERVERAADSCGRDPRGVRLMAVSKTQGLDAMRAAYDAGLRLFGESRVAEAEEKIAGGFPADAEIHMIGHLQSNKVAKALRLFRCIQSVDREGLIDELAKRAVAAPIDVLLELRTGEATKSGFPDEDALLRGLERCLSHPRIKPRGIMTMAPWVEDRATIRAAFRRAKALFDLISSRYPELGFDTLSMGMSGDFEIAVQEGSTMLRVGTAIFGGRS